MALDPKKNLTGGKLGMSQEDRDKMRKAAEERRKKTEAEKASGKTDKKADSEPEQTGGGFLSKLRFWGKKGEEAAAPVATTSKTPASETPKPTSAPKEVGLSPLSIGMDANDDSGDLSPAQMEMQGNQKQLREDAERMLQKKLGRLVQVKDAGFETNADMQINIPIPQKLVKTPDELKKEVDAQLENAGFADGEKRKAFKQVGDGFNWNIQDKIMEQLLPPPDKREKNFSVTNHIRNHQGLEISNVIKIKGGYIITGVPKGVSRDVLLSDEQKQDPNHTVKNGIKVDVVVGVEMESKDIKPLLDAFLAEQAAAEAAARPAEPPKDPKKDEEIGLAPAGKEPPPAPPAAQPKGNVFTPGSGGGTPIFVADDPAAPKANNGSDTPTRDLSEAELAPTPATATPAANPASKIQHSAAGIGAKPKPTPAAKPKSREEKITDAIKGAIGSNYMLTINDKPAAGQGTYELLIPDSEKSLDKFMSGFSKLLHDTKREDSDLTQWEVPEKVMLKLAPKPASALMKPDVFNWIEKGQAEKDLSERFGTPVKVMKTSEYDKYILMGVKKGTTPGSQFKFSDITPQQGGIVAVDAMGDNEFLKSIAIVPLTKVTIPQAEFDKVFNITSGQSVA